MCSKTYPELARFRGCSGALFRTYPALCLVSPPRQLGLFSSEKLNNSVAHLEQVVESGRIRFPHWHGIFLSICLHLGHFLCLLLGVKSSEQLLHTFILKFYHVVSTSISSNPPRSTKFSALWRNWHRGKLLI